MSAAPRVALVQIRSPGHRGAELQEQACFLERCGVEPERLVTLNVVAEPRFGRDRLGGADVLLIGGAGSHSVTEDHDFHAPLTDLVREWIEAGRPLFGSCWGHQFIAQALGGRVVTDREREEVGTFDVELTPAAAADPLFGGLPSRFSAHFGHHDVVDELPPGVEELAWSERCRNQALRVTGKPVYGTQFHCEMTLAQMRHRLGMYRQEYVTGAADFDAHLDRILAPTPVAETLLERFLAALRRGEL
ncbi:MAG TPA: type 1 glutamine amidotransferase [Thermoanaerobaculia bacterium]|nr:type 1 glutamine amidotransferase [Thermoanaerobaculia bacterium]